MFGIYRDSMPIYGSGGFTTYSNGELEEQLGGWVARDGCAFVKMKVGSEPDRDPGHVKVAKQAIGKDSHVVRGRQQRFWRAAGPRIPGAVRRTAGRMVRGAGIILR
jgi:hypothetical protein